MIAATRQQKRVTTSSRLRHIAPWTGCVLVVIGSIMLRIAIARASPVQLTPDSPGYLALADILRHGTLADDPGERAPIYPLLLAICGIHLNAVRVVQMMLGILITAALCWLAWRATRSFHVAALVAGCYGLSISAILHEDAILTETLATALIVGLVCLVSLLIMPVEQASACKPDAGWKAYATNIRIIALGMGILAGVIALTRPLYVFLPAVLIFPVLHWLRRTDADRRRIAQGICCLLLPALVLIGGWSAINLARFGVFAPTVLTGYNLSNHSGGFIEYAPERDAVLRDLYLQYRAAVVKETGSYTNTIWEARPELLARTGMTNAELSQAFTSLSVRLFIHHPVLYARSVGVSWLRFWNAPGMIRWDGARNTTVGAIVGGAWMTQRVLFITLNAAFVLLTLATLCFRGMRRQWSPSPFLVTLGAIIWATSIVQAILERGSNTRFGVPTQPLVAFVVIVATFQFFQSRHGSRTDGVLPAIAMGQRMIRRPTNESQSREPHEPHDDDLRESHATDRAMHHELPDVPHRL